MTYHYSSFRAGSRINNNQSAIVDENDKAVEVVVGPMASTTNTNDINFISNDTILEEMKIQQHQQNWQSKKSILVLKQEEQQVAEEEDVEDQVYRKVLMMGPVNDADERTQHQPDVGGVPITSDVIGWKEETPMTATAITTTSTSAAISTEDDVTSAKSPLPLIPPVVSALTTLSDILVAASAVCDDSTEAAVPNVVADANKIATTPTAATTTGTATTTSIPRCVCSWKNCRAYQKAFRQIQHPLFDGVIRIKLVKDHAESMAYQQCLKRVLGIQNEPEWKVQSSPPSKPASKTTYFCKYIVAKHHFTEQHIRKYEENVKTFSFVKPFSYHGAKKYLYKIDLNETTSNANSSTGDSKNSKDVSYFQCPNVPSDIVKVEYHNIVETIRRRKNVTTNSPKNENQPEEAEHAVVDDESPPTTTTATVRSSSQEESMIGYDSVDITASSCGNTTTKASNVPPPATAKKRTQTTTLSSSYDDCDYSTSSRPPSSHNNDNDTTSLVSYMTSATTEMLRRKDIENRLLKEQLDAMKSQLSFLHDMVQKLQEQHFDGTSSVYSSSKKSRTSRSKSRPNQNKNITAGTRRGSKKFTATKIATEISAKVQQRCSQNSTGNKNAIRQQQQQQQQRADNKRRDEGDDDVDDDDNDDNEEYCNDTASKTWSLLDDASEVQTQATFHSKFNMLSLRSNDDDESDEDDDDNDDDECYSYADCMSIGASTILSASRSVKSLPRELELDEDDDDTTEDDDDDDDDVCDDDEHDDDVSSFRCDNSTAKSMNSRQNEVQHQQQRQQQSPCDASHQSAGTFATPNSYQAGGKNRIKLRQLRVSNGSGNNKNKIRSRNRINGKNVGGSSIVSMHNSSTCSSTVSNTIEGNDIIAMSPAAASSITCSIVSPASFDDIKSGNKNTNTYRRSIRRSASPASRTTNSSEGGGGRGNDSNSSMYEVTAMAVTDPYGEKGTYTGSISQASGMPHGHGRLEYDDAGRWYEGNWRHGRWTGHGRLSNGDGDYYEGGVKDDLKHGRGFMQFADGRTFSGRYFNGQMVHGKMTYEDGSTYDGSWVEGMRHGFGRCVFADSSVYQGEFKDGEFCGRGKMTWNDGGWYDGEWCNGEMHGYGREVRYDGSLRHDGEWWRGQPVRQ